MFRKEEIIMARKEQKKNNVKDPKNFPPLAEEKFENLIPASGTIEAIQVNNIKIPYKHQEEAFSALDVLNRSCKQYSTLVVLPTGGGKTFTASRWLLINAINNGKKVLWLAHRHLLLEQAALSFKNSAHSSLLTNVMSFNYRIVSGLHCSMNQIKKDDKLLIASKDSLRSHMAIVKEWLEKEDELFFIIDEAHHATSKTYRKIIDYIKETITTKIIGLTATPYRTNKSEEEILARIFRESVLNNGVVRDNSKLGIAYNINLKDLMGNCILATPKIETYKTEKLFGANIGLEQLKSIQERDLPPELAEELALSRDRNAFIVDTYKNGEAKYGQTIVFALNQSHAVALNALFKEANIQSEVVISNPNFTDTNSQKIQNFRDCKYKVLINVTILTEGADLPKTQTVFLTRPTISMTLMTQMIGRALRGEMAGGTADAYIVSFMDDWEKFIGWVTPDSVFIDANEYNNNEERKQQQTQSHLSLMSIAKIEEFARCIHDPNYALRVGSVDFIKRIPLGMYIFSYVVDNDEENQSNDNMDISCHIMIYDSTKPAYEQMLSSLAMIFDKYKLSDKLMSEISEDTFSEMADFCENEYFSTNLVPPHDRKDIIHILKYYSVTGNANLQFYPIDDVYRNRLDISKVAQDIHNADYGNQQTKKYIQNLWDEHEENILRIFFSNYAYFKNLIYRELAKIDD